MYVSLQPRLSQEQCLYIKLLADTFQEKIKLGRGSYTTVTDLLRLNAIFQRLSPDEGAATMVALLDSTSHSIHTTAYCD